MTSDQQGRAAQERARNIFLRRPEKAVETVSGAARVGGGLTCRFEQGGATLDMDMPEVLGGDNTGPTPGFFGRAAITGCLAIGIKMAAVREGLVFEEVAVRIDMDFDSRCIVGIPDTPAAPANTKISVRIETGEPAGKARACVDAAMAADPWFLCFRDAQSVDTEITLDGGGE
jgi:uncharacterized OsmC-like protein